MYKLLLCWRYLRTRYIALASIISVTLGVATMIVVNSVMAGFGYEMENRIHGILSDLMFESRSIEGFPDPQWHMAQINEAAGEYIAGMTPTVHVPAILTFQYRGQPVSRQVTLIGIDPNTQANVGDFSHYLQHPANRQQMSFDLRPGGYDTRDHSGGSDAIERPAMADAGWPRRLHNVDVAEAFQAERLRMKSSVLNGGNGDKPDATGATPNEPATDKTAAEKPAADGAPRDGVAKDAANDAAKTVVDDPFAKHPAAAAPKFDPRKQQNIGLVMGIALSSFRTKGGHEQFLVLPGDDVKLTFPTAGMPPKASDEVFTVVDFYESKMSEYDSSFVFVPIETLQKLRGMFDPRTKVGYATSIQIKLKDERMASVVEAKIREKFPSELYTISTWRDKQGPLLAAVQMETAILNVLLFMIIAVAGFGILAIFFMIVVEKTRDIGILKSLGASGRGIMGIFLGYGLSLGAVGSGAGCALGLLFVFYINELAALASKATGHEVFDPSIYYFYKIPTITETATVLWIVGGALVISTLASVLPARRAAGLHPVEALRYE